MSSGRSAAPRWELAALLRQLRLDRGLTIDDVAQHLMCSTAKVSRMERGDRGVQLRDVRDLALFYELSAADRDGLMRLAEAAKREPAWLGLDVPHIIQRYLDLEGTASRILWVENARIPGLLQTADYTRALLERNLVEEFRGSEPLESWVTAREERRKRLTATPPLVLDVVLDEACIRRQVGSPRVMAEQTRALVEYADLPSVTLRIVPFEVGAYPGMDGPILLLEFEDKLSIPDTVHIEGHVGYSFIENATDVNRFRRSFEAVRALALPSGDSAGLLRSIESIWKTTAGGGTDSRQSPG